jgi:hypothetical protein
MNLRIFTKWWWENKPFDVPDNPVKLSEGSHEFVMFRDKQFQVEQITLYPHFPVPAHCHPNVDTYESHLVGSGVAWVGENVMPYDCTFDIKKRYHLRRLRIEPGVLHGGMADTMVVAISCQQWLNDVPPTFITDDWVGEEWL